MSRVAENARWAAVSFRRMLALGSNDLDERQSLLDSGIPLHRVDALYPLPSFLELLPHMLDVVARDFDQVCITEMKASDPVNLASRKTNLGPALQYEYSAHTLDLYGSNPRKLNWTDPTGASGAPVDFKDSHLRALYSVLWHGWWMMTNRDRLSELTREYADEMLLATIDYALPSLKAGEQPRFKGFQSWASDELY